MFEGIKRAHRLSSMGSRWLQATNLDPGDHGQIVRAASRLMEGGATPENAWLTALVGWINHLPWPDEKRKMGHALQVFLDRYEGELSLNDEMVRTARRVAEEA